MKKHPQQPKHQPHTRTNRTPVQELTDEQLHQVTGGLNPQPLPPGMKLPQPLPPPGRYEPPDPCDQ